MGLTTAAVSSDALEWVAALGSIGAIAAVVVSHKIQATPRPDLYGEVHSRHDHITISNSGADAYRVRLEYSGISESPVEPLITEIPILNKGDSINIAVRMMTPSYGHSPSPRITIRYRGSPRWWARRGTKHIDLIHWVTP